MLDGYCVACPNGQTWNGQNCVCPANQILRNGLCVNQCGLNELVDANGYCYSCPLNEMIVDQTCQCRVGYERHPFTRQCNLICDDGQIVINGRCATCSLNTVFDAALNACVCPAGTFKNSVGVCEQFTPTPVTCNSDQYYDQNLGCLLCPLGCSACESASRCTACYNPSFLPVGAICRDPCGDGQKSSTEACDDGNNSNGDGCSSNCMIETGYECTGVRPSRCSIPVANNCGNGLPDSNEQCDDNNMQPNDGCSSTCQI